MPILKNKIPGLPRLLVVEPHPDDAFLSVGWHLEKMWKGVYNITILTVYSDDRRAKEAKDYAAKIGAFSIVLGMKESPMDDSSPEKPIPELKTYIENSRYEAVVFPLGLQHRDHKSVSLSAEVYKTAIFPTQIWWYVDTPYQCKLKLAGELSSKLARKQIVSVAYPSKTKWRHISIFKSQSKFFYFNDMESFAPCEMIVKG